MELAGYVEELRRQLLVAAEATGGEARLLAERLTAPLEASVRLVLLDALTAAAADITVELAPGSVDVRLRGRDPEFVVTPPPDEPGDDERAGPPAARPPVTGAGRVPVPEGDEGATARLTLRLPEQLKTRVEHAAAHQGVSVNAWLARAAVDALESDAADRRPPPRPSVSGQRFTGWAR
jgi:hypothetical protein